MATSGRKLVVDEIRDALEDTVPGLHPASFRPRFLMQETMTTAQVVDALHAIAVRQSRRFSEGVSADAARARERAITPILHHDLRQDMRCASQHVMSFY